MKISAKYYPKYGLLGEKQITEIDHGATRVCLNRQNYYPFYNENKGKTDKFVRRNTFVSRSYYPSETGSNYFWVDKNVIVPQKKLGITARQYGRYCNLTKESYPKHLPLVIRVEIALKEAGLDYLIRIHKVK